MTGHVKAIKTVFTAIICTLLTTLASATPISLFWQASSSTNVVGYAVYYGYRSGEYPTRVDVGNNLSFPFQTQRGTNYFFVVTAYAADGIESLPSAEVSYLADTTAPQIVITTPTSSPTFATTNSSINLAGTASDEYGVVQVTWSNRCSSATGVGSGTTSWMANNVSLCIGTNLMVINARDTAGNVGTGLITIIRNGAGGPCTIEIDSSSTNFASAGGIGSVNVIAGSTCSWTASSALDWVTILSLGGGTGNGAVAFQVAPNPGCAIRNGNLMIADQNYNIAQSGGDGNVSVSQADISLPITGGTFSIEVVAGLGCVWNVTGGSEWVQLVSAGSGEGNAVVQFIAQQNTNCDPRHCSINFGDHVVNILQRGLASEPLASGTFNGLFSDTLAPDRSGFFTLKKRTGANFTGNINLAGWRRGFSGKFNADGFASVSINRTDTTPLILHLQIDLCNRDHLTGTLVDGEREAPLLADSVVLNSKTNPAPSTGKYTFVVLGISGEPLPPGGIGFATAKVLLNGMIRVKGTLGDGENFSQSIQLSKEGSWPFYVSLYRNEGGSISGWLDLDPSETDSVLNGNLTWIKPAIISDKFYPDGFSNNVAVTGSIYSPPTNSAGSVLDFSNGTVTLSGAELVQGFAKDVMLLTNKIISIPEGADRLSFKIKKDVGLFSGAIQLPGYTARVKFRGGLLQNKNAGYGLFFGTNQMGQILLEPTQ